jgi:hypothetical protein
MKPAELPAAVLAECERVFQERKAQVAEDLPAGAYNFPRAEAPSESRQVAGGGRRVHHGKARNHNAE